MSGMAILLLQQNNHSAQNFSIHHHYIPTCNATKAQAQNFWGRASVFKTNLKAKFLWYGHQKMLKCGKYEVFSKEALHFPILPDQSIETFEQKS
jgi:hypothetical protein